MDKRGTVCVLRNKLSVITIIKNEDKRMLFITTFISILAILMAFFSPIWSWVILTIPSTWLYINLYTSRRNNFNYIPEISVEANEMLRKFGHYYHHPVKAITKSSSASAITLTSGIITVIGIFKLFWIGIAFGIVYYSAMAFIARQYNPTNFLHGNEHLAHEEIKNYFIKKL